MSVRALVRLLTLWLVLVLAAPAFAERQGPADLDMAASSVETQGRGWGRTPAIEMRLIVSHAVPYRVYFLDKPARLVVDFRGLDFAANDPMKLQGAGNFKAIRWGRFRPGWSRLVAELPSPYALTEAVQHDADGQSAIVLRLNPVKEKNFQTRSDPLSALWDLPESTVPQFTPRPQWGEQRPLRVAIDPGHGGQDPGAQVGPITEAAVMLGFSLELSKVLKENGIEVIATRDNDSFVPLEKRMTIARAGGADLMISLHADALPQGQAAGVSIYVWDPAANDRAASQLAMRHDRDDLLAGMDLSGTEDEIVRTLMDIARVDTLPRSRNLAGMLMSEMSRAGLDMHRRPVRGAAFSVLKSPDIPSVLIELGFLTDANDRANLLDPDWRARMAQAITRSVASWASDETARTEVLRR